MVDADLRSISPEWIQLLVAPVLERGYDYVAPYYLRHKYDGTITNSIVYPLTRALYGERVRQPIGGDFGFSGRLAGHYLGKPVWDTDVARYGIDIWMTTTAICDGFKVCQSFLGTKLHDAKDPGADLSAMLVQVLGTVFSLMETYEPSLDRVNESRETPVMGFRFPGGRGADRRRCQPAGAATSGPASPTSGRVGDRRRRGGPATPGAARLSGPRQRSGWRTTSGCAWCVRFAVGYHHRLMDRQHLVRLVPAALHGARRVVRGAKSQRATRRRRGAAGAALHGLRVGETVPGRAVACASRETAGDPDTPTSDSPKEVRSCGRH